MVTSDNIKHICFYKKYLLQPAVEETQQIKKGEITSGCFKCQHFVWPDLGWAKTVQTVMNKLA